MFIASELRHWYANQDVICRQLVEISFLHLGLPMSGQSKVGESTNCLSSFNYWGDFKRESTDVLALSLFLFFFFSLTCCFSQLFPVSVFAGSERSGQTAAVAKSSLGTYQMTLGALGVPKPMCTQFFGDRSLISEEAWEEMEQNKWPVRSKGRGQLQEIGTSGDLEGLWEGFTKSPVQNNFLTFTKSFTTLSAT